MHEITERQTVAISAAADSRGMAGKRLRALRNALGVSANDLANATGGIVSRGVIANLESGRKLDMTTTQAAALAAALGVSPLAFLDNKHALDALSELFL